jgi:two-component system LytT family response regulator
MTDHAKIRVVVVDDEELGRDRLETLLAEQADIAVVGTAADGRAAVEVIERERPDLVFLDVQMPEMDGFEVVESLELERMPAIVFVTAYDAHALRAFEVHALDFLVKPFDQTRFEKALEHARGQIARLDARESEPHAAGEAGAARAAGTPMDAQLMAVLEELRAQRNYPERLIVKTGGRVFFVRVDDVDWVEASGNYVKVHAKGEAHLIRESMKNMEARLDPKRFVRIHRSAIVNIDRIKELEPWFHGEYIVIMRDGTRLTASRVFSDRLSAMIG